MNTTLPTAPIRRMYAKLALVGPAPLRAAFSTVCDVIDMGILPAEILTEVVLGQRTLSQAMTDLAEVMADIDTDEGEDEDERDAQRTLVAACRSASTDLKAVQS